MSHKLVELKEYPPVDDNWSDDKKEEYYKLIRDAELIHEFGNIVERWVNNPEVIKKREEYLRLHSEEKI